MDSFSENSKCIIALIKCRKYMVFLFVILMRLTVKTVNYFRMLFKNDKNIVWLNRKEANSRFFIDVNAIKLKSYLQYKYCSSMTGYAKYKSRIGLRYPINWKTGQNDFSGEVWVCRLFNNSLDYVNWIYTLSCSGHCIFKDIKYTQS